MVSGQEGELVAGPHLHTWAYLVAWQGAHSLFVGTLKQSGGRNKKFMKVTIQRWRKSKGM